MDTFAYWCIHLSFVSWDYSRESNAVIVFFAILKNATIILKIILYHLVHLYYILLTEELVPQYLLTLFFPLLIWSKTITYILYKNKKNNIPINVLPGFMNISSWCSEIYNELCNSKFKYGRISILMRACEHK